MFDQTFVNTQARTRRPWTVAISLALQTSLIAVALIAPLLHVASLELPWKTPMLLPYEKVDLKVMPERKAAPPQAQASSRRVFHLVLQQFPMSVPRSIDPLPDAPYLGIAGAATGTANASLDSLLSRIVVEPQPAQAPLPKPQPSVPSAPIRVGTGVQSSKLIFQPKPAYPQPARITRTQGTVKIQAVIARDGSIRNLKLLSGPPLLIDVAMAAVRHWRYQPTLLNGEPVEVITEIDVNFTLSQ